MHLERTNSMNQTKLVGNLTKSEKHIKNGINLFSFFCFYCFELNQYQQKAFHEDDNILLWFLFFMVDCAPLTRIDKMLPLSNNIRPFVLQSEDLKNNPLSKYLMNRINVLSRKMKWLCKEKCWIFFSFLLLFYIEEFLEYLNNILTCQQSSSQKINVLVNLT